MDKDIRFGFVNPDIPLDLEMVEYIFMKDREYPEKPSTTREDVFLSGLIYNHIQQK